MRNDYSKKSPEKEVAGKQMHDLMRRLYPICRSITGNGLRETLRILKEIIPLEIREVSTGTSVFDWTIPKEWNVKDAYVKNTGGEKVIDFKKSSLHVLNYSLPVHEKMPLSQLKEHLFTIPEHPDWTPYRTSYFKERWGFCLSQNQFSAMTDGEYEVFIDSTFTDGSLSYGEFYVQGECQDEVLFSTHVCHPSMCNDNLSGVVLCTFLARYLSEVKPYYSYRFLFIPGTIGSITWLSQNESTVGRIKHGLVVACVGDAGKPTYKKSRHGTSIIDRAVLQMLRHSGKEFDVKDFSPYGYDERQYCSPGFDLPVGSLTRTPHGCFPQYHTSADNLEFVLPANLGESFGYYTKVVDILENNRTYISTNQKCEPQLGRRGLYNQLGGRPDAEIAEMALLWVLNFSDGNNSLLDIAERSAMPFEKIHEAALLLEHYGLLREKHL